MRWQFLSQSRAGQGPIRSLWIRLVGMLAFCLLGVGLVTLPGGCSRAEPEKADIILLHTGRLRGNFYPLSLQEIAPLQHYPYLVSYIARVREEAARTGARVLLVDLGDSLQGSFASYATDSANVAAYFNETAYDAILLGNLDNRVTPAQMERVQAVKLSPFLGPDGQPALPGTAVAARLDLPPTPSDPQPLPVFLVSNFYGDTAVEQFPDRFPATYGALTSGVVPDRRPVAEILRNLHGGAPLPSPRLVLFCWMKFEAPNDPPEHFLQQLREAGVDAILAQRVYGSSQVDAWDKTTLPDWNPPVSQNILRQNAGFTLARMDLRRVGSEWKVVRQELVPMTANTAPASEAAVALQETFAETIRQADRVLGNSTRSVPEGALLQSCLRALAARPEADVVIYSAQSIRSDLPEGSLTASRLFRALPWTAPLVAVSLTPPQLEQVLRLNPTWVVWQKTDLSSEERPTLTVVTSSFFAGILSRQLGLPSEARREIVPSEFDYFVEFFGRTHLLENPPAELPEGWNCLSQPGS